MMSPEQQRSEVLLRLSQAVGTLSGAMDHRLALGTRANVGYSLTGARDSTAVAAVKGGLVVQNKAVHAAGDCIFDADPGIARIILSAAKFDPAMRSAAVIRYSHNLPEVLEEMFLECCTVDRHRQPAGISTMDWGVASCCKEGVPEAVIDPGSSPDTAAIYLFGETPGDVTGNIIMLSNRIIPIEL